MQALPFLTALLKERNQYQVTGDDQLTAEVNRLKAELDLRHFEARLFSAAPTVTMQDIDKLDGYEFERVLKQLFEQMGYQVDHTQLSGDQGADLVLTRFGERIVVQAKRYANTVGNKAVQEAVAAVNHYRAHKGMVVTNNYFTRPAVQLAMSNQIELIDRQALDGLIKKYLA